MEQLTLTEVMSLNTYLTIMLDKNAQHFGEEYSKQLNEELNVIIEKLKQQEQQIMLDSRK